MKSLHNCTAVFLVFASCAACSAASIEWTGRSPTIDFFDEANWIITEGFVGNFGPGSPPPAGTIDPFLSPTIPAIMHDLFLSDASADFSAGDIGLDPETGSLTLAGDSSLDSAAPFSILSVGGFGASVRTRGFASLNADFLDGIQLSMFDMSNVFLTNDQDPLSGRTQVMLLSTMPSPCLVFDGISPFDSQSMYSGQISGNGPIDFMDRNPFGTIIKAADSPEPSSLTSVMIGLAGLGMLRRRKQV